MVSPENTHTININQTELALFKNIYVYTYRYVTTNEKTGHESESKECYMGGLEGEKKKGKWCDYIKISKLKEIIKNNNRRTISLIVSINPYFSND